MKAYLTPDWTLVIEAENVSEQLALQTWAERRKQEPPAAAIVIRAGISDQVKPPAQLGGLYV